MKYILAVALVAVILHMIFPNISSPMGWVFLFVIMAVIVIPNVVPLKYFLPKKKSRP